MSYNSAQLDLIDQRIRSSMVKDFAAGTVTSRSLTSTDNRCMVTLDGGTVAVPAKMLGDVYAFEGDRVVLQFYGTVEINKDGSPEMHGDWVVAGTFARRFTPSEAGAESSGGAGGTTVSSTFAPVPNFPGFTFTKQWDDTRIRTTAHIGSWASVATDSYAQFAIDFDGTFQQEICGTTHNTINEHRIASGLRWRSGLAAGTYTVSVLWKRLTGTATITLDSNDNISVMVTEVSP